MLAAMLAWTACWAEREHLQMSQPAAYRALPGKGQAWRRSEKYEGFSWHSCWRQSILEAGALLDKVRSTKGKGRRHAIDWRRCQQLPGGYDLQVKKPVKVKKTIILSLNCKRPKSMCFVNKPKQNSARKSEKIRESSRS